MQLFEEGKLKRTRLKILSDSRPRDRSKQNEKNEAFLCHMYHVCN